MILHDFRNFTGSIQMSLDILSQTQDNLTAEQKEVFGYIGEGNEKLKYLSEKLAASAATEDSKIDYEYADIELGSEVEQVVVDLNDAATMKQINLQLNIDPSSSIVYLDKVFLNELLVKLFSSVIRHTSSNAIVSIHLHKLDGKVVIDIASKGKVLGLKKLEQLFNDVENSVTSTETVSKNTSGFSVAKKLAEKMGGKITYNSDEITGNFYRLEFNLSNK
jgi:K+-sensing histidine kinase KdpD